jgi:hypothetical protein
MKLFFVLTFLLFGLSSYSQDSTWTKPATVVVHKDSRIDSLVKKQSEVNEELWRIARKNTKGFRILIINTNKRDEAIAAKTRVYSYFPELKAYLIYQSPYFRLKVGNFREREEAEVYQRKLKKYFPNGAFIMNDIIEVKPEFDNDNFNSDL